MRIFVLLFFLLPAFDSSAGTISDSLASPKGLRGKWVINAGGLKLRNTNVIESGNFFNPEITIKRYQHAQLSVERFIDRRFSLGAAIEYSRYKRNTEGDKPSHVTYYYSYYYRIADKITDLAGGLYVSVHTKLIRNSTALLRMTFMGHYGNNIHTRTYTAMEKGTGAEGYDIYLGMRLSGSIGLAVGKSSQLSVMADGLNLRTNSNKAYSFTGNNVRLLYSYFF